MTSACRICLSVKLKLRPLNNHHLIRIYDKLSDNKFNSEDARPRAVCNYCYQKLVKSYNFAEMVQRSELVFSQFLAFNLLEDSQHPNIKCNVDFEHLSIMRLKPVFINGSNTALVFEIKKEIEDVKDELPNKEDEGCVDDWNNDNFNDNNDYLSDNNDIPNDKYSPDDTKSKANLLVENVQNNLNQVEIQPKSPSVRKAVMETSKDDKFSKNKMAKFTCEVCGEQFRLKQQLTKHINWHASGKAVHCRVCDMKLLPNLMSKHMRAHAGENSHTHAVCSECGKLFSSKYYLITHMRIHTGERPYICIECGKTFWLKATLLSHSAVHRKVSERPLFSCSLCDKQYTHKEGLKYHMITFHTKAKPFVCSVCGKQFKHKKLIMKHMRVHTGEKPYACSMCDKRFSLKWKLTLHMRVHTGERPYACSECDGKFKEKSALDKHRRTHTGEKPYACSVCDKRFAQQSALKTHTKKHS